MKTANSSAILELHFLKDMPAGNVNRGLDGAPKSIELGGVLRARISSQSLKRQVRLAAYTEWPEAFSGRRSKEHWITLSPMLVEAGCPALVAEDLAKAAMDSTTGGDTLVYIGEGELREIATRLAAVAATKTWEALVKKVEDKKAKKAKDSEEVPVKLELEETAAKSLKKALDKDALAADIACFGRMLASSASMNIEAAVSVAHAIGVHQMSPEVDFFTAVDDLRKDMEETGAGHLGTNEMHASTMYHYVCIDLERLRSNLSSQMDLESFTRVVTILVKKFLFTTANGKQTTMAARTEPLKAIAVLRSVNSPVQVSWDVPVVSETGYGPEAVTRMTDAVNGMAVRMGSMWGEVARAEYGGDQGLEEMVAAITKSLEA